MPMSCSGPNYSGNESDKGLLLWALLCVVTIMRPQPYTNDPAITHPNPEEETRWIQGISATARNGMVVSERSTANVSVNSSSLLNLQEIGLKIVELRILFASMVIAPYVISIAMNIFQEFETNPSSVTSTQMLKLYFGLTIMNIVLGTILYVLSTAVGSFYGKAFFLKATICLIFALAIVEIVMLFAVNL